MFPLSQIIGFESVAGIYLIYDENTCDRQSTCYQTVVRFRIWQREMFSNSIFPTLIENWDKGAVV